MRLVSPYTVLVFVVVWTVVFLLAARNFLFNAHQVRLFRHRRTSRCNGCHCLPLPPVLVRGRGAQVCAGA